MLKIKYVIVCTVFMLSCQGQSKSDSTSQTTEQTNPILRNTDNIYTWHKDYIDKHALVNVIPTPKNYKRRTAEAGSFANWLRFLPIAVEKKQVLHYDGSVKGNYHVAEAILDIDVGNTDLQQCADAVMRIKSEYHYSKKDFESIHFNYTSGHKIAYLDWINGKRPVVAGNSVKFKQIGKQKDSYKEFRKYLKNVFMYAGTASLEKEVEETKVADIKAGDIFIHGGFPGHTVIVVDVAEHIETGKPIFLIAQSFMPAQDIHILKNFEDKTLSPWYSIDFGEEFRSPEYYFSKEELKRFKN